MTPERDQQIMDVFLAATEQPTRRRQDYLDEACSTDQALRAEVESLLKHHAPETLVASDDCAMCARWEIRTVSAYSPSVLAHELAEEDSSSKVRRSSIIFAVSFASLWYLTHHAIRDKLRGNVESQLQTVLNADVGAVEIWLSKQKLMAQSWAGHDRVRTTLSELARLSSEEKLSTSELEATGDHAGFLESIGPLLAQGEVCFVGVFSRDGHVIAKCPNPPVSDVYWSSRGAALVSHCFRGETVFLSTFRRGSNVLGANHDDFQAPAVSVVVPVRSEGGDAIAAMQLIMHIDHEFAAIFSLARLGTTGDSYAFDKRGIVLTDLRHEEDLWKMGLIPEDHGAALHLQLRDPGVDLRTDPQTQDELTTCPLCKVPAMAIANGEAVDADGYRNYSGAKVVGAAKWLPRYDFGVVTEIEYEEAYAPLQSLAWLFGGVFGLFLCAATVATLVSMNNYFLRKHVSQALNLGQYTLGELIGQGGMAKVYKATHSVLRRPTAIKLIEQSKAGDEMVARFEREAQLAAELTHPNTIQIYDYGHTKEGVFYFAMEYLPGLTLAELVARDGPLPAGRVVHLLRQVCGSLEESHGKGLVHRDIKPANIMLCERGGQYDFVKVLDFGLAKSVPQSDLDATARQDLTGTPLYIAPERICRSATLDGRSDIYSVGSVAFYLLTGEHLFDGDSSLDVLYRVVNEQPRHPSELSAVEIPAKLDELVNSCLSKDPDDRPASTSVVIEILDSLSSELPWTQADARQAWRCNHESGVATAETVPSHDLRTSAPIGRH